MRPGRHVPGALRAIVSDGSEAPARDAISDGSLGSRRAPRRSTLFDEDTLALAGANLHAFHEDMLGGCQRSWDGRNHSVHDGRCRRGENLGRGLSPDGDIYST